MANFNKATKGRQTSKGFVPTVNHEGATVHKMNDLETLFSQVLGSFFGEATHYDKKNSVDEFKNLYERIQRVPESDKEYILKIAEIGRLCNMIDYPLNILSVVYNDDRFLGLNFVDDKTKRNRLYGYANNIILRTKDITTLMATQFAMFDERSPNAISTGKKNKSIPMQLRKTLRKKIQSYDKFKLSKGLSKGSDVTLKDCISLLRPKPKNEEFATFYKSIIADEVKVGNDKAQIKTELTKKGQDKTKKVDNTELTKAVAHDNLMNIVKNLVALHKQCILNDKQAVASICLKLRDPKEVKASRLLPFRFLSAYKEVMKLGTTPLTREIQNALVDALDLSIHNVEPLEGTTAILVDLSQSMDHTISGGSVLQAVEVACVLASIAHKVGTCDLFVFSNTCTKVEISNRSPVMEIAQKLKGAVRHGGTDLNNALHTIESHAQATKTKYDSLVMFSDNDCYGYSKGNVTFESSESQVTSMIKRGVFRKIFINNLLGNDFSVANTNDPTKNLITGFSEQCLNTISIYNMLGNGSGDIKKVIDMLYNKLKGRPMPVVD